MRVICFCLIWLAAVLAVQAYDPLEREESTGLSLAGFRSTDGKVYGGGFESGVWIIGTPIFGEIYGHRLKNDYQGASYYSVGSTVRLMTRTVAAPFVGLGGSYNTITSERILADPFAREPDSRYWKGHAEAGLRWWLGARAEFFLEGSYRHHWTETGRPFNYGWFALEWGQRF